MPKFFKITKDIDIIADKVGGKLEPLQDQLTPVFAKVDSALTRVDSLGAQFGRVAKESQTAIEEVGRVAELMITLTSNLTSIADKVETFSIIGGVSLLIIGYIVFNGYQQLNRRLGKLENELKARDDKEDS